MSASRVRRRQVVKAAPQDAAPDQLLLDERLREQRIDRRRRRTRPSCGRPSRRTGPTRGRARRRSASKPSRSRAPRVARVSGTRRRRSSGIVAAAAASDSASPPNVVKKNTSRSSSRITSARPVEHRQRHAVGDRLGEASRGRRGRRTPPARRRARAGSRSTSRRTRAARRASSQIRAHALEEAGLRRLEHHRLEDHARGVVVERARARCRDRCSRRWRSARGVVAGIPAPRSVIAMYQSCQPW